VLWTCPACGIPIRHSEVEERPRPKTVYRCYACRMELVLDEQTDKLVLPLLPSHKPPQN
jgi:hypothetical protein